MAPTRTPRRATVNTRKTAIPKSTRTITKTPKMTKTNVPLAPLTPGWTAANTDMFGSEPLRTPSPYKNRRMTRRSSVYVTKDMLSKKLDAQTNIEFKKPAAKNRRQSVMPAPKLGSPALTRNRRRESVYVTSTVTSTQAVTVTKTRTPSPQKPLKPAAKRLSKSPKKELTKLKRRSRSKSPKKAPAKTVDTAKKPSPPKQVVKKASPARKATPSRKASPVRKSSPARKATPAKKAPQVKKLSPPRKASPVRKESTPVAKKSSTSMKQTPKATPRMSPGLVFSPRRTRQTPQVNSSLSTQVISSQKRPREAERAQAKRAKSDSLLATPTKVSLTPGKFYVKPTTPQQKVTTPKPAVKPVKSVLKVATPKPLAKATPKASPKVTRKPGPKSIRGPKTPLPKESVSKTTPKASPKATPKPKAKPVEAAKTPVATPKPSASKTKAKKVSLKSSRLDSPSIIVAKSSKTPFKAAKVLGKNESPSGKTPAKASKVLGKVSAPLTSTPLKSTRKRTATGPPPVSEIRQTKLLRSSNQDESVFPINGAEVTNGKIDEEAKEESKRVEKMMDVEDEKAGWMWGWNCNIL